MTRDLVAVKKIDAQWDKEKVWNAEDEGELLMSLKQPNIVLYMQIFVPTSTDPHLYIFMELMQKPLDKALD